MRFRTVAILALAAAATLVTAGSASADPSVSPRVFKTSPGPQLSGAADFKDAQFGTGLTECPQAGMNTEPTPLDRRVKDEVEKKSGGGNDTRTNTEYSCFPQNEMSIDVNPTNNRNIVAAQNDYRLGWGTSGIDVSVDNGNRWYDLLAPFPSLPSGDNLDGGGDPALVFDRAGVVYYADINFNRTDDTNGIWVRRSTNGGFTWSRPCVAINVGTPTDDKAVCGGSGDPRRPGDGTVVFQTDNNNAPDFSVNFNDKEYIAAGPRPTGVTPVCFAPETKTPIPAGSPGCPNEIIGVDRIYVTWSSFNNPAGTPFFITSSTIEISYSDDQARSWSPRKTISGSAPFCAFAFASPNGCDDNQFSTPTVHPKTGLLGVSFENFNTPDENQYLFVRSTDGGNTFAGPFFVTPVFDVNFPRSGAGGGRPDCTPRGQQNGRIVYTNSCFRSNAGGNVTVDKRDGAFADDFYLVMSDNRNGTRASSNADVFLFKSLDGGATWIGPTRVNDDGSTASANRDCGRPSQPACPTGVNTGNDQWWPWVDINHKGDLNIAFKDRRLDVDSTLHEWPTSRQRPGNYLVWTWGANCEVDSSSSSECVAPGAAAIPQPTAPIDPSGPFPGGGPAFQGPFENFGVSDTPSNFDYSFRNGIFAGDYDVVAVEGERAYSHFTDARNGRSSGNVSSPAGAQPGRNPACEQSDSWFDSWSANGKASGQNKPEKSDALYLVTPCPDDIKDDKHKDDDDD